MITELLYAWFCSLRRSVTSRIPGVVLKRKAEFLVEEHCAACLQEGVPANAPAINSDWLLRFRTSMGISLRQPNRKWKVPKAVLLGRLKTTWLNTFRIRQLCLLAHGAEPFLDNVDQCPFHRNESGSKDYKTLHFRGCPAVA